MRRLVVLLVPFLLAAIAVGAAPAAGAHGAEAALSVVLARDEGTGMRYIVRVVYQNDGEPVPNATVTALAIGPDGTETAPVTFTKSETLGEYVGFVPLDAAGPSSVRFAVVQPKGELTITDQQVVATTVAPSTTAPATTAAPPTTIEPSTTEPPTAPAVDGGDDGSGGSSAGAPVVLAALAAAVVMAGVVVVTRRRR